MQISELCVPLNISTNTHELQLLQTCGLSLTIPKQKLSTFNCFTASPWQERCTLWMLPVVLVTSRSVGVSWKHFAVAIPEPDTVTICFTESCHDDLIPILQELACLSVSELDGV